MNLSFQAVARVLSAALADAANSDHEHEAQQVVADVGALAVHLTECADQRDSDQADADVARWGSPAGGAPIVIVGEQDPAADDTQELPAVDVKPQGYDHKVALNTLNADETITTRDTTDGRFKTTLSAADTTAVLRGEEADSFPEGFVKAALYRFLGRTVDNWEMNEGRLVVYHR